MKKSTSDKTKLSRRVLFKKGSLVAMATVIGAKIPYAQNLPKDISPVGISDGKGNFAISGKIKDLTVLNDRPVNCETPPHLLDDDITPADHLFVRNNGLPPKAADLDPKTWTLEIGGESCLKTTTYSLEDLKKKFKHYTYQLQLECGGNGRAEYNPPAKGNQWALGAVGCVKWTGVRVRDVLEDCGIKDDAVYLAYEGGDSHLSGDPKKLPISRGVPIKKALEDETLIAWSMNDADIPYMNGFPLRLVCSGWPASASGKWLKKLLIRNIVHDGPKMGGYAYRVPKYTVAPGSKVPEKDMKIIESMPVKSLITFPKSGINHKLTDKLDVRGHAWAGDLAVKEVHVSIDFGATWIKTELKNPANRLAWQRWNASLNFKEIGYYEVWVKATDEKGVSQPMVLPGWNPKGYLNNSCHRIAIQVEK